MHQNEQSDRIRLRDSRNINVGTLACWIIHDTTLSPVLRTPHHSVGTRVCAAGGINAQTATESVRSVGCRPS